MSRWILKTFKSGGPSLSNLPQCLTLFPVKSCLFKSNRSLLHWHLWPLSPALLLCSSQGSLALTPLLLQRAPCSALSLVFWQYNLQNLKASHSSLYFLDLLLVLEHSKFGIALPLQWKRRIPCPNSGAVTDLPYSKGIFHL